MLGSIIFICKGIHLFIQMFYLFIYIGFYACFTIYIILITL